VAGPPPIHRNIDQPKETAADGRRRTMNITADLVKQLRERTGAGMMECKKALVETQGDLDSAAELMRKSGLAKADKKATRVAAEGTLAIERGGPSAVLMEINSETDFVARSDEFQGFARDVAKAALTHSASSVEDLVQVRHGSATIEEQRRALIAKIGENIAVRRFVRVTAPGALGTYLHGTRIGALVALQGGDEELARDLAMHVAAVNPAYIDASAVPADVLDKEREILTEQTKGEKKPPEIIAKMVEGRLRKFLAEITLLGQPFVKDPEITVEKLLKKSGAKVVQIVRYEVGEGLEKKQDDFVGEVMAQVKSQSH
jgi:elongation factor Ts